jgi:hypothetical protein
MERRSKFSRPETEPRRDHEMAIVISAPTHAGEGPGIGVALRDDHTPTSTKPHPKPTGHRGGTFDWRPAYYPVKTLFPDPLFGACPANLQLPRTPEEKKLLGGSHVYCRFRQF